MKVLVTGANGFLGSHVLRRLVEKGIMAVALVRKNADLCRINDLLGFVSLRFAEDIESVFDEFPFSHVVHTAASYGRCGESLSEIIDSNIGFPVRILDLSSRFGVKVFVNIGTLLPENVSNYSLSKSQFSQWLFMAACSVKPIDVRVEIIYGPGDDDSKFIQSIIGKIKKRASCIDLTLGEQVRDFIYIDDVVDALMMILEDSSVASGVYELGGGDPVSVKDVVTLTANVCSQYMSVETELRFGVIPYRKNECMSLVANITKMAGLGWLPNTRLCEGLDRVVASELS